MSTIKLIVAVATIGLLLGIGSSLYKNGNIKANTSETTSHSLSSLPEFSYPDLQDNQRSSAEWRGKIVVLNFWATWCPPCRKEIPHFIEVQKNHKDSTQFVGIAIDDKDSVVEFAEIMGINYPTLLGDMNAIGISKQLGNSFSGLPFTAIFDQQGKLIHTQVGEILREELEAEISKLL